MGNFISMLIDLDEDTRLMTISTMIYMALSNDLMEKEDEEGLVKILLAKLALLDGIRESIDAQELLTEEQKDYIWSIVMEGV